ncbi:T9SS type A sorting domain-containing protein [Bacteroidota bacterium]
MKYLKLGIFVALAFLSFQGADSQDLFDVVTDSSYIYIWDDDYSWIPETVLNYHHYPELNKMEVFHYSKQTRTPLRKLIYSYDENEFLIEYIHMVWRVGVWENLRKYDYSYNQNGLLSEVEISEFTNEKWEKRQLYSNYTYSGTKVISNEFFLWDKTFWKSYASEIWEYDDQDRLFLRTSTKTIGNYWYRIYNSYRNDQLWTMKAEVWTTEGWRNKWIRSYKYNKCGQSEGNIYGIWSNEQWININKTLDFLSYDLSNYPFRKIELCHNGKTIGASTNSISAHLLHGDCLGECVKEYRKYRHWNKYNYYKNKNNKKSADLNAMPEYDDSALQPDLYSLSGLVNTDEIEVVITPNPIQDLIYINFNSLHEFRRATLYDITGREVSRFEIHNQIEILIKRPEVPAGLYILKLDGIKTLTNKVLFQ